MTGNRILNNKFRPGFLYQLEEWNQLNDRQQKTLAGFFDAQETYGLFIPVEPNTHLTTKIAYRDAALLYRHLQNANILPYYAMISSSMEINNTVIQLVLDGILEIECNGKFLSGPGAVNAIYGESFFDENTAPDKLSLLSKEAVEYGYLLESETAVSLAKRLYSFNTIPWNANKQCDFLATHTVKEFLFSATDTTWLKQFKEQWLLNKSRRYWYSWNSTNNDGQMIYSEKKSTFKLFISPDIYCMPEIFKSVVPVLSNYNTNSFKTGSTLDGLLRPDKMVAYFENADDLKLAAHAIQQTLNGVAAHGVPFTKQLDDKGLLSWGIDLPSSTLEDSTEGGSWRSKITECLAEAIILAKAEKLCVQEAFPFIRAKLSTAGVNAIDWSPLDYFFGSTLPGINP